MVKGKGATIPTGDPERVPTEGRRLSPIRFKDNLRDLYPITAYKVIGRVLQPKGSLRILAIQGI